MDTDFVARAAALYGPLCITVAIWVAGPPTPRERAAVLLATAWNLPALLAVHVIAVRAGWWTYAVQGGTLAGLPVDLYIGWAVLWGTLPALVARRVNLPVVVLAALAIDVAAMSRLAPTVQLGSTWLVGEVVAILVCLVPAQLLARWTRDDSHVGRRAVLQMIAFGGLAFGVLPQTILEQLGGSWSTVVSRPAWVTSLLLQCVALGALLGVSALQEFATRGFGTPVPFDPPKRLVVTGPYAYVRNPMQLSAALAMAGWGAMLESWWVVAAGVMAVVYGAGFAAGDERVDLEHRFGPAWLRYATRMRAWWPRWRPLDPRVLAGVTDDASRELPEAAEARRATATLYVAEECGPCSQVRAWFQARSPVALEIVAAERHPHRSLTRITYDPGDGTGDSEGVLALGRALEHVHFGWAMAGMFMRLPVVSHGLQLITDASGGGPRQAVRYCERPLPIRSP